MNPSTDYLIDEFAHVLVRAKQASPHGMLELALFVESVVIDAALPGAANLQRAKDDTLAALHAAHLQALKREAARQHFLNTEA